jgi:putative copper export protein
VLALAAFLSLAAASSLRALCLALTLGGALTMSLTGHAADQGDLTASVGVDWVHAVAAAAWTGGIFGLALAVLPRHASLPAPLLGFIGHRFSRLAGFCLLAVLATGVANAWTQIGAVSRLWSTAYGRMLVVKVTLVVFATWLGATNRYLVVPHLDRVRGKEGSAPASSASCVCCFAAPTRALESSRRQFASRDT